MGPTENPTKKPTGTPKPTAPATPSPFECFQSGDSLREAVIDYVNNGVDAKEKYGPVIGSWCVDKVQDFNRVFKDMVCIIFGLRSSAKKTHASRCYRTLMSHLLDGTPR
jgi:hypothetical protein